MSEILSERIPLELEGTPVSSIMIEEPFTCTQDCTISDVVRMLAENEVSSMPVIDERNQVVGFISDGDVMGAIAQHRAHTIFTGGDASMLYFDDQSLEQRIEDLKDRCVMDFATRQVVCARPEQSIARVAALLAKKKFKKLPVVDDEGKLVGVGVHGTALDVMLRGAVVTVPMVRSCTGCVITDRAVILSQGPLAVCVGTMAAV